MSTPQNILEFTDLPDVLIDKIAQDLDAGDIIKLLSTSKKTQEAFRGTYHIIHDDSNHPLYSALPKELHTSIDDPDGLQKIIDFKGTLLLEVRQMETSWLLFFDLINVLSQQTTCQITIYGIESIPLDLQEHFHRIANLAGVDKGFIKSIHLPDITNLHFSIINFDPSIFKIPKVKRLALGDCKVIDPGYKVAFPELVELYIEDRLSQALEVIEVPKTLLLRELLDVSVIDNLKAPDLEFLKFESCRGFNTLKGCNLPNLKYLEIYDTPLDYIIDLTAPKALSIVVESGSAVLSWCDLEVPSLKEISLNCASLEQLQNINAPQLDYSSLNVSMQPPIGDSEDYENPCKVLENAVALEITGSLHVLEGLTFHRLESLGLVDEFEHRLTKNTKFPVLKNLQLSHNELIQQVPTFIAPQLTSISVIGLFNFISINNLPGTYPSLKNLTIDNCPLSTISDIDFPALETLDIQSDVSSFTLTNCHFANLKQLVISPKANTGISLAYAEHLMKGTFQFTAPKLTHLMLTDMLINKHFSTAPFPILESLGIFHAQELEIVDSENLVTLELSNNEGLEKLEMGILPNLKEFYPPRNMDTFTKAVLNLAKHGLESKGDEKFETIETVNVEATTDLLDELKLK